MRRWILLAWLAPVTLAAWKTVTAIQIVTSTRRPPPEVRSPEPARPKAGRPTPSAEGILSGGLFSPGRAAVSTRCDRITLVSTVVTADRPWSFAAIRTDGDARLYRIGDRIGDRTLVDVDWRSARLSSPGSECRLDLFDPPAAPDSRVSTDHEIDRALARLANDPRALERLGRLRPVPGGLRLQFSGASPLRHLGLERGDVIREIDGRPATDLSGALAVWQRLLAGERVTIGIERRGERRTLGYRLR